MLVQTADVKIVALDLDGTLVDQRGAARKWAGEFIQSAGLDLDVEVVQAALGVRRPKGEIFADLVRTHALPVDPAAVWADYRLRMPQLVTCTDEDKGALADLRSAGWLLGIVTNGMVDNKVGKIRQLGLDALVHGWVVSEEIGARKPSPEIFRALGSRLGCALSGWMVGDSLEQDIAGGASVGLRTAWVTDTPGSAGSTADVVVASVAEAAAVILAESS
jgi:FMN phosphatase YigB (HAD superfamily)